MKLRIKYIDRCVLVVISFLLSLLIIRLLLYFIFIYFNEDYKSETLCPQLIKEIALIEVTSEKINGDYIQNHVDFTQDILLKNIQSHLSELCVKSYNKHLTPRFAKDIIKCRLEFNHANNIYLVVVRHNNEEGFVEFHKGGVFSLIGSVEDAKLVNLILQAFEDRQNNQHL